jgi:hypothetical protein
MWLCLDATNRRQSQPLVGGYADPIQMDEELAVTLADHKASQIASTIRYLTDSLPQLTGRHFRPGTRFVPLVVTPEDGLPWNPAVHRRGQELVAAKGTLQTPRATKLGIVSLHDLGLVERAADDGGDAGKLLETWRSWQPEVALQHFLHGEGVALRRPQWELDKFSQLVDELIEQQTANQASISETAAGSSVAPPSQ